MDVTADYVGKYGVKEGESAKAWRIALNPDACFDQKDENGEYAKITADDYIYSMQQHAEPQDAEPPRRQLLRRRLHHPQREAVSVRRQDHL